MSKILNIKFAATSSCGQGPFTVSGSLIVTNSGSFAGGLTSGEGIIKPTGSKQTTVGQYNIGEDTTSLFVVGNGINEETRQDAFAITGNSSARLHVTQSATPAWSGSDGEFVFGSVGGQYYMFVWMAGAWSRVTLPRIT
jgi:hypothetical protein